MRILVRFILRLLFRFEARNEEVLRSPGPALLVPNHVSWLDWLYLLACVDDHWKFVTSSVTAQLSWLHRVIMINRRTFPIDPASPYAARQMAEYLAKGGCLVLFAEGRLSRTGSLMKIYDGTGFLLRKTGAKIITCYLRGANRQKLAAHSGWKIWFPKVQVFFSDLQHPPGQEHVGASKARATLTTWLQDCMVRQQLEVEMSEGPANLPAAIESIARQRPGQIVLEDITLQRLSLFKLMVGADALSRALAARLGTAPCVGVLLPNANAHPVTLLALWSIGRVPAVLNYSTGSFVMLNCAHLAGLKQIITSRSFLEKARLNIEPLQAAGMEFLYLEDVRAGIGRLARLYCALRQKLGISPGLHRPKPDDVAVVLFTSGSEGTPKGVELTHHNLLSNIRQMLSLIDLVDNDRMFNALPLFHSFGLSVGCLLPLIRGLYTFLYPTPLHYRLIPNAIYSLDCTLMLGTNTFLNGYARRAHPYDFRKVRYLFTGGEKLQESTSTLWAQKFGLRILEGYGATECSPCVSVNTLMNCRIGSAGRILPLIEHRLEPVEGVEKGGRLWVKGPNVMRGYLNQDANEKFAADRGWYDTGDIVSLDEEGFVHILGRSKRFAKISGEMVSLTAVEDALAGAFPQYGQRCLIAILTRHDPDKGEAMIAVSNEPKLKLDEIRKVIRDKGFTNLCVPREILSVHDIPKLGTGKVDYRELQKLLETNQTPSSPKQ